MVDFGRVFRICYLFVSKLLINCKNCEECMKKIKHEMTPRTFKGLEGLRSYYSEHDPITIRQYQRGRSCCSTLFG